MKEDLGLIHVYCGDGKGKTTASLGLAIRCAGSGFKVLISRFLKNNLSGELNILNTIPNICVMGSEKDFGFFFNMSESKKKDAREYFTTQLIQTFEASKDYDLLILDEINAAVELELIDEELLISLIMNKPEHLETVLTGRNPSDSIVAMADYVSEIKCVKHPFDKGITSRKGIEE